MHERVRLAVIALDEAEAFHRVEELDRSAGLLAGELALRTAIAAGTATATGALDRHRLTFDAKVSRRNAPAAIDEGELKRLTVGQVSETRLLDRGDVNEHVLSAVVAYDEAKALLRIEEFDDAFGFADDLGRHPAATAATAAAEASATTAAAAAISTAAAAVAASPAAVAVSAAAAATAESASPAAVAAALLKSDLGMLLFFAEETVALITTASAAVSLAPSIETHACSNFRVPTMT